jgi:hypothetical protein
MAKIGEWGHGHVVERHEGQGARATADGLEWPADEAVDDDGR